MNNAIINEMNYRGFALTKPRCDMRIKNNGSCFKLVQRKGIPAVDKVLV
jgi:hypothetical protein